MAEDSAIATSTDPVTGQTLRRDLAALGLGSGDCVLVHSSLSSLGWVCGGAVAVVEALLSVLGPDGTLVVPTHSSDLSDPSTWHRPAVPEDWWDTIRATMPAFRAATTPTRGMGAIAEVSRTWPRHLRSEHPQSSFAAIGPAAAAVTSGHQLDASLGEGSPLARLYERDARVLLLGVGHDRNTSMHLAEYRTGVRASLPQSGPVLVEGRRTWLSWDDIDLESDDFSTIGADFDQTEQVRTGLVGQAYSRLMPQRALVDFAATWLRHQQRN